MTVNEALVKRAQAIKEKRAFQPMPGGQPPADPNAQPQGGAGGGQDPSMMGGAPGGMPPMDPSMMGGGAGGMGMPPVDPMTGMPMGMSMGAPPPATIGQLSITDFQNILTDTLTLVLQQIIGAGGQGGAPAGGPPEVAPQSDVRTVSNTELSQKVDAILEMLSGAGAAPGVGGAPAAGGAEMGFGGQGFETPVAQPAPGMEAQASVKVQKESLADMILRKTAHARKV